MITLEYVNLFVSNNKIAYQIYIDVLSKHIKYIFANTLAI